MYSEFNYAYYQIARLPKVDTYAIKIRTRSDDDSIEDSTKWLFCDAEQLEHIKAILMENG